MKKSESEPLSSLLARHSSTIAHLKAHTDRLYPDIAHNPRLIDGIVVDELFFLRYVLSDKSHGKGIDGGAPGELGDSRMARNIADFLAWKQAKGASQKGKGGNHHSKGIDLLDTDDSRKSLCGKLPAGKHGRNKRGAGSKKLEVPRDNELESLVKKIPFVRTGELKNGFPVMVLPVAQVDFEFLFSSQSASKGSKADSDLANKVLDFMLLQKEKIFQEIDAKSRAQNRLIKSVTVYDLNGMSFSSIYKLTKFFKLVQGHTKKFKAYFPQSTHSTVIVNSPGTWVLKMFSRSNKQKVLTVQEFLETYDAHDAVPSFLNGNARWPLDFVVETMGDDLASVSSQIPSISSVESERFDVKSINEEANKLNGYNHQDSFGVSRGKMVEKSQIVENKLILNQHRLTARQNRKVELTRLEREMIFMKKNKIFSIDILESNQEVSLFFVNNRKKSANVLIALKEEDTSVMLRDGYIGSKMYSIVNSSTVLQPGFNHLKMSVKKPGEILLIYVSRDQLGKSSSNLHDIETMRLKKSLPKRAVRKVGKIMKAKKAQRQRAKLNAKQEYIPMNYRFGALQEQNYLANEVDKVFFRFEVSDKVHAGQFSGKEHMDELMLKESTSPQNGTKNCVEVKNMTIPIGDLRKSMGTDIKTANVVKGWNSKLTKTKDGLIDYDDSSVISSASRNSFGSLNKRKQNETFLSSVGQLFGWS